jgi:hypothetical protein
MCQLITDNNLQDSFDAEEVHSGALVYWEGGTDKEKHKKGG